MSNTPTDAEIWQMWMSMTRMDVAHPVEFARAVLAKWGTPPAVAGEPVAWMYDRLGTELNPWFKEAGQEADDLRVGRWDTIAGLYLKPCDNHVNWKPLYATPQPTQAQEPCQACIALARTVMLDQVSFDRKPDCYGIRQITDDEGIEEWEDIRTSPDVAREEANDMMATGRGEIYEVVPLWTTPQPAPAHPDDAAVDALAAAMKAKLAKQRAKGYSGWDTTEFTQQRLSDMLREHVDKGDPVDVANFCAFLAARGEGIAQAAPRPTPQTPFKTSPRA